MKGCSEARFFWKDQAMTYFISLLETTSVSISLTKPLRIKDPGTCSANPNLSNTSSSAAGIRIIVYSRSDMSIEV